MKKVAFITGVARGQGRAHAVHLAAEGIDIIGVDICKQIDSVSYPMASSEDLAQTVTEVEKRGGRIHAAEVDVRDRDALSGVLTAGIAALGVPTIVIANAGIAPMTTDTMDAFQDAIDVNLLGVFNTVDLVVPSMIEAGQGGAIVLISSTAGLSGMGGPARGGMGYAAAKHGLVGLMRNWANSLAQYSIRVNTVHPTGVRTAMTVNLDMSRWLAEKGPEPGALANALPIDLIEPDDIVNAVAWLVSDSARYVTGVMLPVDAGFANKR